MWASRTRNERGVIAACLAGLVAVPVAFAVIAATSGSGDAAAAPRDDPAATSAHEVCTAQVWAMATNIHDNHAYDAEEAINGSADPFLQYADKAQRMFVDHESVDGSDRAAQLAHAVAESACTVYLNDAVRPNYPTDCTYPQ